jgi:hypothetical protein
MDDGFVTEEWYCTKSGGGCGGYILVRINKAVNGIVEMVCPKCKHKHQRVMENGVIKENGRFSKDPVQEIMPVLPAWSEKPRLKATADAIKKQERDGVIASSSADFLSESWLDRFGKVLTGQ